MVFFAVSSASGWLAGGLTVTADQRETGSRYDMLLLTDGVSIDSQMTPHQFQKYDPIGLAQHRVLN